MRVAIVSDIHANLEAFEAVLADAEAAARVDAVWCLGDTVGYGPQPGECISRLLEADALWVAGNHERAATGAITVEDFNPDAATAALWTQDQLSEEHARVLDALPEITCEASFTCVHGTLRWPIWEYLYSEEIALAHLQLQETPVSFVGHTHVPMVVYQHPDWTEEVELYRPQADEVVRLPERGKIVINPGSVGQPRDGDPRAAYAIYDSGAAVVELRRVEYDIFATQRRMKEFGLPRWLIDRLSRGR